MTFDTKDLWRRLRRKVTESRDLIEGQTGDSSAEKYSLSKELLLKVKHSFERVMNKFLVELDGSWDETYESYVGKWTVLAFSLITVLAALPAFQDQLQTLKDWVRKLWNESVGDPANLIVKDTPFSEALACRWAVKQLNLVKMPKEAHDILSRKAADPRVLPGIPTQTTMRRSGLCGLSSVRI